jgi:hypothetical protein
MTPPLPEHDYRIAHTLRMVEFNKVRLTLPSSAAGPTSSVTPVQRLLASCLATIVQARLLQRNVRPLQDG